MRVAICGRDQQRLDGAVASLRADGGDVVGIRCDVTGLEGGRRFVVEAVERLGGVDILVANAGGPPAGGFDFKDPGPGPRAPQTTAFGATIGTSMFPEVEALVKQRGLECADTSVRT